MIINLTLASLQEPYTAKLIAIRANLYQNQNRLYRAEKRLLSFKNKSYFNLGFLTPKS